MNLKRFTRSLRLFFSIIAIVYYTTKSALLLPLDTRPYKTNRIRVARANLALEKARYHALTVAWLTEPTIEKNGRAMPRTTAPRSKERPVAVAGSKSWV